MKSGRLIILVLLIGCALPESSSQDRVCFDQHCFDVEVVKDPEEIQQGLMHRTSLDQDKGMLFIFPVSRKHSFWMKDTFIPLDMIWLNHARKIVHIEKNAQPCQSDPCLTYTPSKPALYVLEINAGISNVGNLKIGDVADFQLATE